MFNTSALRTDVIVFYVVYCITNDYTFDIKISVYLYTLLISYMR
jgi:hypothetical protein